MITKIQLEEIVEKMRQKYAAAAARTGDGFAGVENLMGYFHNRMTSTPIATVCRIRTAHPFIEIFIREEPAYMDCEGFETIACFVLFKQMRTGQNIDDYLASCLIFNKCRLPIEP